MTGTLQGLFRTCIPGETCGQGGREPRPLPSSDKPPSDADIDQAIDEITGGDE